MRKAIFETPMIDTANSSYKPSQLPHLSSFDESNCKIPQTQLIDVSNQFESFYDANPVQNESKGDQESLKQERENGAEIFINKLKKQYKAYEQYFRNTIVAQQVERHRPQLNYKPRFSHSILEDVKKLRQNRYEIPPRMMRTNEQSIFFKNQQIQETVLNKPNRKINTANPGQLSQNFYRYINLFNENPKGYHLSLDENKKIRSVFAVAGQHDEQTIADIISLNCTTTLVQDFVGVQKKWWVSHRPDNYRFQYYVIQRDKVFEDDEFEMDFWLIKFEDFLRVVVLSFPFNVQYMNAKKGIFWHQDFKKRTHKKQNKQPEENNTFDRDRDFEQTLKSLFNRFIPKDFPRNDIDINLNDYVFENIDIILIPSFPGKHGPQQKIKYGLDKISRVIKHYTNEGQLKMINPIITTQCYLQPNTDVSYVQHFASAFTNNRKISRFNFRGIYPKFLIHPRWGFRSVRVRCDDLLEQNDIMMFISGQDITPESWGVPTEEDSTTIGTYSLGFFFLRFNYQEAMRLLPYDVTDVIKQPFDVLAEIREFEEPDIRYMLI